MSQDKVLNGINYREYGEGKVIVLLPGWGQTLAMWEALAGILSKRFKVFSIDLPGFGKSSTPEKPYNLDDYAEAVKKFNDTLKIENPILIGHSYGGDVAYVYCSKYTALRCILVGATPIKPKYLHHVFKLFLPFPQLLYLLFSNLMHPGTYKNYVELNFKRAKNAILTYEKSVKSDLPEKINQKVYILHGREDRLTPLKESLVYSKNSKDDVALSIIENAGHYPFIENESVFLTELIKILESQD